jgi:GST-like protein
MIEVWSWPTPNGQKVHIALEELGLPYEAIPVNIGAGEQFKPAFLEIAPNNRIPAIVDPDGPSGRLTLFESGAILIYLAEKAGRLIPADPAQRYTCLQWLMFQMGGVGPMFGQYHHFATYAPEKIPYTIDRYGAEVARLYRVLNARLADAPYLAGADYSIADIATFPWARGAERRQIELEDFPHLRRWLVEIESRPAVQRGLAVLAAHRPDGPMTQEERKHLFGAGKANPRVGTEVPRVHVGR